MNRATKTSILAITFCLTAMALTLHSEAWVGKTFFMHSDGTLDENMSEPFIVRTTAYTQNDGFTPGNTTATGKRVRHGHAAYMPEYFGWTVIVYAVAEDGGLGEVLMYAEIQDTGGKAIRSGKTIDIYHDTLKECREWMKLTANIHGVKGYKRSQSVVYVQLVRADG